MIFWTQREFTLLWSEYLPESGVAPLYARSVTLRGATNAPPVLVFPDLRRYGYAIAAPVNERKVVVAINHTVPEYNGNIFEVTGMIVDVTR